MLTPLKWLENYVDIKVPVEEYARWMIMTGSEVEGWETRGGEMERVVAGRILEITPHPNADRLCVCRLDVGGGEPIQIVTGATNVFAGARVPVALHDSLLPGGTRIRKGKLRGEVSMGMLCSGRELCIDDSVYPGAEVDGILILTQGETPGTDMKEVLGFGGTVVDFKTLANRPDCMSMIGMARETAVTLGEPLRMPSAEFHESSEETADYVKVSVEAPALCPRYMGRIITGVRIAPSPDWMRKALLSAGVRPINNIVDITNYVMLEMGQPLHAFDFGYVAGGRIVVRTAREGEVIETLDGKRRKLTPDMLVIADAEKPVAVAGIMGGEYSGVYENTQVVMLESANFLGSSVRVTSRSLGLRTESSARFEKGLPPQLAEAAMNRAMHLMEALGAGRVARGAVDVCAADLTPRVLTAHPDAVNRLLGQHLGGSEMADILNRLFMETTLDEEGRLVCRVPYYRQDMETTADIAEEIQRIHGYDTIPCTPLSGRQMQGGRTRRQRALLTVKETLAGFGLHESVTYSFMSPAALEKLLLPEGSPLRRAVAVANPLGEEYSLMRTTLAPALLQSAADNASRQIGAVPLFEMGAVFAPRQQPLTELPAETLSLGIALLDKDADFFTLKGMVEALCAALGAPEPVFAAGGPEYLHPGRKARCRIGDRPLGALGQVHPSAAEAFGIEGRVYLAELDMEGLLAAVPAGYETIRPLPKYPAVTRDLAVTVKAGQPVGPMLSRVREAGGALLEQADLFDIYEGAQLGQGVKSVAFAMTFRSPDRTLTDEEAGAAFDSVVRALADDFGAEIRT